jgi:hypothetical protein
MPSRFDVSVEQPGTPPEQRTGSGWQRYFCDGLSRGKAALGRLIPAVPPSPGPTASRMKCVLTPTLYTMLAAQPASSDRRSSVIMLKVVAVLKVIQRSKCEKQSHDWQRQ